MADDEQDRDRNNDAKLLTPLLLMALLIACAFLYYQFFGAPPSGSG